MVVIDVIGVIEGMCVVYVVCFVVVDIVCCWKIFIVVCFELFEWFKNDVVVCVFVIERVDRYFDSIFFVFGD